MKKETGKMNKKPSPTQPEAVTFFIFV